MKILQSQKQNQN